MGGVIGSSPAARKERTGLPGTLSLLLLRPALEDPASYQVLGAMWHVLV